MQKGSERIIAWGIFANWGSSDHQGISIACILCHSYCWPGLGRQSRGERKAASELLQQFSDTCKEKRTDKHFFSFQLDRGVPMSGRTCSDYSTPNDKGNSE